MLGVFNKSKTKLIGLAAALLGAHFGALPGVHAAPPAQAPIAVQAFAPGRVEIIGNHLDYLHGVVMAMALEEGGKKVGVTIDLVPNADPKDKSVTLISVIKDDDGTEKTMKDGFILGREAKIGAESKNRQWVNYFQGVTSVLREAGYDANHGYTMTIRSDIPGGGGLSSSAALEVAQIRALRKSFGWTDLDDVKVAKIGQKVENGFVGANTGLMDQFTISLSDDSRNMLFMDFADPENPKYEKVPFPDGVEFVVFSSGVKHDLSDEEGENFNKRRKETTEALERINQARKTAGLKAFNALGELVEADLRSAAVLQLPEKLQRRVRHAVTEGARVREFREAIRQAQWKRAGELLTESHRSSRDHYEVCAPEVDKAVQIALEHADVIGARMVGGGFGGPMLALVKKGKANPVALHIAKLYAKAMLAMHPDASHRPIGKIQVGSVPEGTAEAQSFRRELQAGICNALGTGQR